MKRLVLFILAFAPILLAGCAHNNAVPAVPPTVQAHLVRSVLSSVTQIIQTTGTLHAQETAMLSAQIPGRIRRIQVQAGDRVRTGQVLVILDDAAMESALLQAQAGATAAEKQQMAAETDASLAAQTLARYQILKDQKSVSPQEFDEVQKRSEAAQLRVAAYTAQSQLAEAAVSGAKVQCGYGVVRAPFAGIVTARLADPGSLAAPGMTLLQIDREGPLQLYTSVDESLIGSLRERMKVQINIEGLEAGSLTGTVAEIVPAADPASHSFQVKVDLPPGKNLHAGMFATASFPGEIKPVILVSRSAVVLRGSLALVYALDDAGVARLHYVTLGDRHGDQLEILSGVAANETLIDQPGERDWSGNRIEAQR
jgi:RND family efflux transporter MFP subunit